jgi:putative membrane protein
MKQPIPPSILADHPVHRKPADYIGLALRGVCMGCADVVPGVSGGTMAFILGIYEELVESIRAFGRPPFWQALVRLRPGAALEAVNFRFLAAVLSGIGIAVLALARLISWLLEHHPVPLWSFFFGLVLASVYTVSRRVESWSPGRVVSGLLAATVAFLLVGLVPLETPDAAWFLVLCGAVGSCAMILPGVSGAFLLVLLGKYQTVLDAVHQRELGIIVLVGLGAALGLVAFSQVLSWLFRTHHDAMVATLTGLMLGSLRKVWPWKEDIGWLQGAAGGFVLDGEGKRIVTAQANFLPDFSAATQEVVLAAGLAVLGLALVLVVEQLAHGRNRH